MSIDLHSGKLLKMLVWGLLRLIGSSKSLIYNTMYSTIYMTCLLISLFGSTIGLINSRGKVAKIESLVCFYINWEVNCLFATSIMWRNEIRNILHMMRDRDGVNLGDIIEETAKFVNREIISIISAHNLLAVVFVMPPLFVLFFQSTFSESDESSEIVPYWFACDDYSIDGSSIWNRFCWNSKTKMEFSIKILLELMIGSMSYYGFGFGLILYCVIMAELRKHLEIFKSEIAALTRYAESFSKRCWQESDDNCLNLKRDMNEHDTKMIKDLISIVEYLQYLRRCIREIKITFRYYNDILISECFLGAITVMFMAFNKSGNNMLFKCTSVCIDQIFFYVLFCYFAQIISDVNEIVLNEMSSIPWYEQSLQFRKIYLMVITEPSIPTEMKLFNARVLNLSFLISTFKSAYSILNVLFLRVGKHS